MPPRGGGGLRPAPPCLHRAAHEYDRLLTPGLKPLPSPMRLDRLATVPFPAAACRRVGNDSPQSAGACCPPGRPPNGGRASDPPGEPQRFPHARQAGRGSPSLQPRLQPGGPGRSAMPPSTSPPPAGVELDAVQQLNALARTHASARMRALLPVIDGLVLQGVPYAAIVTALANCGIAIKAASLRQAVCRWRSRQKRAGLSQPTPVQSPAPATPGSPGADQSGNLADPPRITSKADLVRLRSSTDSIDLSQLAEIGRQK